MIDKELSELKKDLPEYNIDNYKSGIYTKYNNKKNTRKIYFPKIAFVSIVLIMFISIIGLSTYAIKVEAQEYQNAVDFFEANELSLDGLTRYEIKEIYKDITTNKFEYKKTGEVIVESIKSKVPGYSIEIDTASSNELISVWELWDKLRKQEENPITGVYYDYDSYIVENDNHTLDCTKYIFTKYEDGKECWNLDIYYEIDGYIERDDYLIVYGSQLSYYSTEYAKKTYITKVSTHGVIVWQQEFNDSNLFYRIFINNDDSITVLTNKTYNITYLKIYNLNLNGVIIDGFENNFNDYQIENVVKLKEYYLIYLEDRNLNTKFVKINFDGTIEHEISYHDEKYRYFFTDMIEFEGQIYLSAYSIPYIEDTQWGRGEIRDILDTVYKLEEKHETVTDEYVLDLFKNHYKAVLFICDNNTSDLKTFYSVDFAIGSNFILENNNLIWNVEYFESMMYSPATSSFTFGGVTQVYNYMYDEKGHFVGINKTDELRVFRR